MQDNDVEKNPSYLILNREKQRKLFSFNTQQCYEVAFWFVVVFNKYFIDCYGNIDNFW